MNDFMKKDQELLQFEKELDKSKPVGKNGANGVKFFKFEKNIDKDYIFRPLPSKIPGRLLQFEAVKVHYNFQNPNKGRNGAFPCLKTWGKQCPLCDRVSEMEMSLDNETQSKAQQLKANEGYLMYAVNYKTKEVGCLQFYGKLAHQSIGNKFKEVFVEGNRDYSNLDKGIVLQISKRGSQYKVEYTAMVIRKDHKVEDEFIDSWNQFPPINEIYGVYTPDNYENVLKGKKFDIKIKGVVAKKDIVSVKKDKDELTFDNKLSESDIPFSDKTSFPNHEAIKNAVPSTDELSKMLGN